MFGGPFRTGVDSLAAWKQMSLILVKLDWEYLEQHGRGHKSTAYELGLVSISAKIHHRHLGRV
jgi:hypothetical protein